MDRRNRPGLTFSLSFLDVMSVGLGAVILLFLIINHASEVRSRKATAENLEAVERLQSEFDAREATAQALAHALEAREEALQGARARLDALRRLIAGTPERDADPASREEVERLKQEVRELEGQVAELRREVEAERAESVLARAGEGRRQYLTGLSVDGERVLILMDISASMLAPTIVGAIRLRNMSPGAWQDADKWQQALDAAAWLAAQIPADSRFQLYSFNEQARSVLPDTTGRWVEVGDGGKLADAIERLRGARPEGGTSLHNAFAAAARLQPKPDAIILITDHTPTVGASRGQSRRISPRRRSQLFADAFEQLPSGVPVNVVALPMEGDPMAASLFWQLSNMTGGVFIAPSRDWP